jgi:prepilin-type N-terminal cleavage/methylation domain-containing protein
LVLKKAFTIIEIIVSVVIIAIVTLTLAKINRQNANMVDYVTTRLQNELSNTLFLTNEAFKYDKSQKDAYTLLRGIKIRDEEAKAYLKKLKRKIYIKNDIPTTKMIVPIKLHAIMLKSEFSTRYYRLEP